ncbi:KICSTOR complex protein kaptin [Frankliniella fusca]|uniref:KICSTOR complex protein kaptin n=1 Tax=Frankliniella fusca TaxID=407009 RepID=A0AAE1GV27_9NEOP|nr:KICSTOR complex protein kaptin [Frankliniella fusca]
MEHLVDAHYVGLPSQGNVYSLTPLLLPSGAHKIILATLRRRVLSFRYNFTNDSSRLKPLVREVHFTCIPNTAEIVSIDAFHRGSSGEDYVIGITLVKPHNDPGRPPEAYLNVYCDQEWESDNSHAADRASSSEASVPHVAGGSTPSLDNAAQNCRMLELGFVPYQLTHTKLFQKNETVWVLGGSDCQVHILREDTSQNCYIEALAEDTLPEFAEKLPSPPLWTSIAFTTKDIRMSATGCECGYLKMTQCTFDGSQSDITASWELQLQGPISCVRFFSLPTEMHWQPTINNIDHLQFNLLVACSIQPSQVFMSVNKQGLSNGMELPTSASGDAVLCGMTADLDLDGSVEVLLGTYGHQLLVYKWDSNSWELRATRTLPHPVHSLHYLDVTGDGVRELLILTPKGLHVFQHHLEHVEDRVNSLVEMLLNITEDNQEKN